MLIHPNHWLGIRFSSPAYESFRNDLTGNMLRQRDNGNKQVPTNPNFDPNAYAEILNISVRATEGFENFVLTAPAQKLADRVRLGPLEDFDLRSLKGLPNQTATYSLGPDEFFRMIAANGRIILFWLGPHDDDTTKLRPFLLYFHVERGITFREGEDPLMLERTKKVLRRMLRYIVFCWLSDIEVVRLAAGQKVGTKKNGHVNHSRSNVVIVTENWNKLVIRTGDISVTGHFRYLTKNREVPKLVYVHPHTRHGYTRHARAGKTKTTT